MTESFLEALRKPWSDVLTRRGLVMVLLLALAIRLVASSAIGDAATELPGTHDEISYDALAQRVLQGHGLSFDRPWYPWVPANTQTSYYSGTMVLYVAAVYGVVGHHPLVARVVTSLTGVFICYMLYRLGRRLFGPAVGLIAALVASGYAYMILLNVTLMTETPFIAALLVALGTAYELVERPTVGRWFLLGTACAIMVLFRMAVVPFLLVLWLWVFFASKPRPRMWQLAVPILVVVLAVLPWTLRNYRLYGRYMLLESQYGHVFWNGNHPDRGTSFDEWAWVAPLPEDILTMNEVDKTNTLLARGIQNVLADPIRFALLTWERTKVFFIFWPTPESSPLSNVARVCSFGILLPFMLVGLYLSLKQWRRLLPLYLFMVIHTATYVVSWVMPRYRLPVDAVLTLFAALAIVSLAQRILAHRRERRVRTAEGEGG